MAVSQPNPTDAVQFPLRGACIDIGSNAIRFVAAFAALTEDQRQRVTRLSAILRLADSLDREQVQRVHDVQERISDQEVTLWLEGSGGVLIEGWSLKKKSQLFSRVFGRKVRLGFSDGDQAAEEVR